MLETNIGGCNLTMNELGAITILNGVKTEDLWTPNAKCAIDMAIKALENRRKIQGQWLINSDGYYPYCSICKNEPQNRVMTKYCPNCGAFMEG